ncbi:MarR family transcriptional regulator [soil metagenome]
MSRTLPRIAPRPAPDPQVRLGTVIAQAARQWRRVVNLRLQPFGLTEATWLPLLRLARSEAPMRQKDLAASLALDNSSVVRLLDNLQVAGLVTRTEHAVDRRAKSLDLTRDGHATVAHVEAVAQEVRASVLAGLPLQDIEVTLRTLDRICEALASIATEQEPA